VATNVKAETALNGAPKGVGRVDASGGWGKGKLVENQRKGKATWLPVSLGPHVEGNEKKRLTRDRNAGFISQKMPTHRHGMGEEGL